jgi:transposase
VARRGAMKARVAAAEQLYGVLYSAPDELRQPLLGLKTKTLVRAYAALRPGPLTSTSAATKTTLRTLARRWQQLQGELDQLDRQLPGAGQRGRAHPGRAGWGRDRHRRPTPGHRR